VALALDGDGGIVLRPTGDGTNCRTRCPDHAPRIGHRETDWVSRKGRNPGEGGVVRDRSILFWLTFDPQAGPRAGRRRPALVLSPRKYNAKIRHALAAQSRISRKGYPFEVAVPAGQAVTGGYPGRPLEKRRWKARRAEKLGTVQTK